ncbi:MAG TPA: ABC transporter permease, partial [Aggregatilineales bacterium]|nr:ABC transporter permease [Aggregatilineales bacterium]
MNSITRFFSPLWQMTIMAFQYLKGRKLRTALTTLAIVFGVALIFAVNVTLPSAFTAFKQTLQATSGQADLTVVSVSGESFAPDAALKKVLAVKGVQAVTGELRRQITLSAVGSLGNSKANQIQLAGIDPATAQSVRRYVMSSGRFLQPDDTGNALLPAGVAELDPENLGMGAVIPLMTDSGMQQF